MITDKQKELLWHKVDAEGFDYCFAVYSDWKDIKDKEFHTLRKAYVEAAKKLKEFIGEPED